MFHQVCTDNHTPHENQLEKEKKDMKLGDNLDLQEQECHLVCQSLYQCVFSMPSRFLD